MTGAATEPLALPDVVVNLGGNNRIVLTVERRYRVAFQPASGGVAPYTYDLQCALPRGLGFGRDSRTLSGTPLEVYRGPDCTYRVTDSASDPATVSRDFTLIVDPFDLGTWRFRTRATAGSQHALERRTGVEQRFAILPHAIPEADAGTTTESYRLRDIRLPLKFYSTTREISYTHTGTDPLFDTPTTFRYEVSAGGEVQDALCVDISYHDLLPGNPPDRMLDTVAVRVRDDAYWDGARGEFRCPDAPPLSASSSHPTVSNPVHSALAPIHARQAVKVAHAAIRDRVRRWAPGSERQHGGLSPTIGIGSLSGQSRGFEYSGSSESVSLGAELGAGSWQTGLVASFTQTVLHYRAGAALSEQGYLSGEHDTRIVSVHPFAAWHAPSGLHLWGSLGAGAGELRHRDVAGFPSWSRSDLHLMAHAFGASAHLGDVLSGELQAEAGIESFALEIEGGDRISSSLPTLRGRDYRAGLVWTAPVSGAPSLSVAYKQVTGDGPEGAQLETSGAASFTGFLHPRLSLTGSAEASFGLDGYEQESWRLAGGLRFLPQEFGRGFGMDLDTGLVSPVDGNSSGIDVRGEVGYGLQGETVFGTMRPYLGLTRRSGEDTVQRSLGVDIGDTSNSRVKVEAYDNAPDRSRGVAFTFRHRF